MVWYLGGRDVQDAVPSCGCSWPLASGCWLGVQQVTENVVEKLRCCLPQQYRYWYLHDEKHRADVRHRASAVVRAELQQSPVCIDLNGGKATQTYR